MLPALSFFNSLWEARVSNPTSFSQLHPLLALNSLYHHQQLPFTQHNPQRPHSVHTVLSCFSIALGQLCNLGSWTWWEENTQQRWLVSLQMHDGSTTVSKVLTKLLHTHCAHTHAHTIPCTPQTTHLQVSPQASNTSFPSSGSGWPCFLFPRTEEKPPFSTFSYPPPGGSLGARLLVHDQALSLLEAKASPSSLSCITDFPFLLDHSHSTPTVLLSSVLTENKREKQKKRSCWPPSLSSCHLFS